MGEQEKVASECDHTKNLTLDPCRHGFRITTEDATKSQKPMISLFPRIGKYFPGENVRPRVLCHTRTCSALLLVCAYMH